jgi:hypothetical protein
LPFEKTFDGFNLFAICDKSDLLQNLIDWYQFFLIVPTDDLDLLFPYFDLKKMFDYYITTFRYCYDNDVQNNGRCEGVIKF